MQPFFSYYGGKWKLAERYGPPQRDHVVEPFAGSAGYSVYWEPKKVTLIERNPVVYGVWKYLQAASPRELMRLPSNISDVEELPGSVCQEAKSLIGFWFDAGPVKPAVRRSNWARQPMQASHFWSETIKLRLAHQVDRIRHWKIIEGSWEQAPDIRAHWHVDPPYNNAAGSLYRHNGVDHAALARWCKTRPGFVQVCENEGATWLPFETFSIVHLIGRAVTQRRRSAKSTTDGHSIGSIRLGRQFDGGVWQPSRRREVVGAEIWRSGRRLEKVLVARRKV
jgi:hypothetical protein